MPLAHGDAQGADAGVSDDPDPGLRLAITEQVLLAGFRGGAKEYSLTMSTTWRLNFSGQGQKMTCVRRSTSTCPTGIYK